MFNSYILDPWHMVLMQKTRSILASVVSHFPFFFLYCPYQPKLEKKERLVQVFPVVSVQSSSVLICWGWTHSGTQSSVFTIHQNTGQLVLLMWVLISISTTHISPPLPVLLFWYMFTETHVLEVCDHFARLYWHYTTSSWIHSTCLRITNLIEIYSKNMLLSNIALLHKISAPHPSLSDLGEIA